MAQHPPETKSQTDSVERELPITYNRAATELVHSRQHVEKAIDSLALALQIFARIGGDDQVSVVELEEVLGHLEELEATLQPVAT